MLQFCTSLFKTSRPRVSGHTTGIVSSNLTNIVLIGFGCHDVNCHTNCVNWNVKRDKSWVNYQPHNYLTGLQTILTLMWE